MNEVPFSKSKKSNFLQLVLIGLVGYLGVSFNTLSQAYQKRQAWKAPTWADTLVSPLIGGDTAVFLAEGEELFTLYCTACHGDLGYGDGAAGGALGVKPASFHDSLFIAQTDGSIFWKLAKGKGNMPPFEEAFSEEQRWQIIAYLRELPKKKIADN